MDRFVYFHGDLAQVVTSVYSLWDGLWIDAILLEGHRKGDTVTVRADKVFEQ